MNTSPRPRGNREAQALERRNQLIDTALSVFAEKGLEGATVKELSKAAGVAQGLMYHYFRSKQDLLEAVRERHSFREEMERTLQVGRDQPAGEVMLQVALGYRQMLDTSDKLVRVILQEAQTNPTVWEMLQGVIRDGVTRFAAYLDHRISVGELRPHDTEVSARTLFYAVFMSYFTRVPAGDFIPAMVSTLLEGVRA